MRIALPLLVLLVSALPAAAAPPPEKPGAALAALVLPPCDYKPDYWTPFFALQAPLEKGDWAKVEGELEELHASFERNHACENRMLRAFQSGFVMSDQLPAQLDRWVAARPSSWTAYTIRGAMWSQRMTTLRWAPGLRMSEEHWKQMSEWAERATADLERAIELHPKAVVAHGSLMLVHRSFSAPEGVEAVYRRASKIDPLSVHVLVTALDSLQPNWGGRVEQVDAILAAARLHEKDNPRIARAYGYGDAARAMALHAFRTTNRGERERIIRLYTKALRYGEPGSDWHYRRASKYEDQGDHAAAIADAEFALAVDKGWERFWSIKAWSLLELGRYDEALAVSREGLANAPDSSDLRWYEAEAFLRKADYAKAAKLFQAGVEHARSEHERAVHLRGLGSAYMQSGRYAEAEPVLTEATRLEQWHVLTWNSLGEARWKLGRHADAVPAYEEFLARSEGEAWAEEQRMRAQEKIDLVRSGAAPPAHTQGR